jgi:hypothetical protein
MVIQVLIPQCQGVYPLPNQLLHPVFDQLRVTMIDKTGRQLPMPVRRSTSRRPKG